MRTEGLSILAAIGLHAGVLLIARTMPPLSEVIARGRKPLDTIDIVDLPRVAPIPVEVRDAPPSPDAPRTPDAESPPEARVAARTVTPVPGPEGPPTTAPDATAAPSATGRPPSQFDDLADDRHGVLGIPGVGGPGSPVWSMPGVLTGPGSAPRPAPTVAPAPRPVDSNIAGKVLSEEMAKNDKNIGLDLPIAGNIAGAVRTAVQGTELAAGTKGSIECRVAANGRVSGCRLAGSNGGSGAAWDTAVRAANGIAGGALGGRYANGAIVTIDVSVSNSPPAGGSGGLKGAGVSFDMSNIGAHATRMVRISHRVVAAR